LTRLIELKPLPVWSLELPDEAKPDPRPFARRDLVSIFCSEVEQVELNAIEACIIGIDKALLRLRRRLDEILLYFNDDVASLEHAALAVFSEYYLRCVSELGFHLANSLSQKNLSLEKIVTFSCFLVKKDAAFAVILAEQELESEMPVLLSEMISFDKLFKKLMQRFEEKLVAMLPMESEYGNDSGAYMTAALGECVPDAKGRLNTKIPDELIRLAKKFMPQMISESEKSSKHATGAIEAMLCTLSQFASNTAKSIAKMNHSPFNWNAALYLSAVLNDCSTYETSIEELIEGMWNSIVEAGLKIDTGSIFSRLWVGGVEIAFLLADIALKPVEDVCMRFFKNEWRDQKTDTGFIMRRACKQLCLKLEELEGMILYDPYIPVIIEAGVHKIAFRYLSLFAERAKELSLSQTLPFEEIEKMRLDIKTMEMFLETKYGDHMKNAVSNLKEMMDLLTLSPEYLEGGRYQEILKKHKGNEDCVFQLVKICSGVREDLKNFYIPAWLNKLMGQTKNMAEASRRPSRNNFVRFDLFHWSFTFKPNSTNGTYIYPYLVQCLKANEQT